MYIAFQLVNEQKIIRIIMDVPNLHINSKNKKFNCSCSERNCNIRLYEVPYQYEAFCFSNALMHIIEACKLFSYTVLHMCQTLPFITCNIKQKDPFISLFKIQFQLGST